MKLSFKTGSLVFVLWAASAAPSSAQQTVARVGTKEIGDAAIEKRARERLIRVRSEEYQIKREVLDEVIVETLFELEATAKGVSVPDLLRLEIEAKVRPVTEDQTRAVYESNPQKFASTPEAEALRQIAVNLKDLRDRQRRQVLVDTLRQKYEIKVLLSPPRVAVETAGRPQKGRAESTVTVVVFSDYQCPYCVQLETTLKQLTAKYSADVRLVYRNFPLSIHSNAAKAAEAAECAKDQGKFWELHDLLFANQKALSVTEIKRTATTTGIDITAFATCLDSGEKAGVLQKDLRDGTSYGVQATPTLFVNGRMMRGNPGIGPLTNVVEEELAAARTRR